MWNNINLENCLSHIEKQIVPNAVGVDAPGPAITISRMCGAGGRTVASKLLDLLQPTAPPGCQWTIFDKNLVEKVLEDHLQSARLAEFVPEAGKSWVGELMNKLRGQPVSATKLAGQTVETIWKLAAGGYTIIVGRGGNVITARMKNVFHLRLVGSPERRIARIEEVYEMDRRAAENFVKAQDAAKRLYLKEFFGRDLDDPQLYHLIVNTDRFSYDEAARLIFETFTNWRRTALPAK
jgi:cytidylate kinase